MDERAALLRGVVEKPEDNTARLVLADWLDENGEADRAAFIRLQLHRTPAPVGRTVQERRATDRARSQRAERMFALLSENWREWCYSTAPPQGFRPHTEAAPALADLSVRPAWPDCRQRFLGGFVAHVELAASVFVTYAGGLFALHPIESVQLRGVPPGRTTRAGQRCYVWDSHREVRAPGWLPEELVRLMVEECGEVGHVFGLHRVEFPQIGLAHGALERVVLRFGRTSAGLSLQPV